MDSLLEQATMFPHLLPAIVQRIWNAHDRHFDTNTLQPLTRGRLRQLLEDDGTTGAVSESAIDRARADYPKLLPMTFPVRYRQRRPWLPAPELLKLSAVDSAAAIVEDEPAIVRWEAFDVHGKREVVEAVAGEGGLLRIVRRWHSATAALVAVVAGFGLLDLLSDGRIDGVIRWCHVLAHGSQLRL